MISGISSDLVALIFSYYTIILEVNNQMNTNILTAVNGASGVARNNMNYLNQNLKAGPDFTCVPEKVRILHTPPN